MQIAEPKLPDGWKEERLTDGAVVLSPIPAPQRLLVALAIFYVALAINAYALRSPGPMFMVALLAAVGLLGRLPQKFGSWEWRVGLGSVEFRTRRRTKVVVHECFQRGVLVIAATGSGELTPSTLTIHDGERTRLLMNGNRETLLHAAVYLAELTGWELTDGTSAESLLRDTLTRKLLAHDKSRLRRLLSNACSIPALLQVWRQNSPGTRDCMISALKELSEGAALIFEDADTPSPFQALRQALDHPEPAVRAGVLELLEHVEGPRSAPLLRTSLEDSNVQVRRQAAASLCRLRDTLSTPALCALAESDDLKLRSTAVSGLSEMGDPRAVPTLCRVLASASQPAEAALRADAATGLGRQRNPEAVPALSRALRDPVFRVRFAAAEALGRIGHVSALSGLEAAAGDPDAVVRASVAVSLGKLGTPDAGGSLAALLRDPDPDVRAAAAEALGAAAVAVTAAIPELCRALDDADSPVRREAARALGRIALGGAGPAVSLRAALPTLQRRATMLSMEAADVKRACRVALERIQESTSGMKSLPLPAAAAVPDSGTLPVPHQAHKEPGDF